MPRKYYVIRVSIWWLPPGVFSFRYSSDMYSKLNFSRSPSPISRATSQGLKGGVGAVQQQYQQPGTDAGNGGWMMLAVDGLAIIFLVHSFFSGSTRAATASRKHCERRWGDVSGRRYAWFLPGERGGRVINRLEKHGTSVERCHRPIALMLHIHAVCDWPNPALISSNVSSGRSSNRQWRFMKSSNEGQNMGLGYRSPPAGSRDRAR